MLLISYIIRKSNRGVKMSIPVSPLNKSPSLLINPNASPVNNKHYSSPKELHLSLLNIKTSPLRMNVSSANKTSSTPVNTTRRVSFLNTSQINNDSLSGAANIPLSKSGESHTFDFTEDEMLISQGKKLEERENDLLAVFLKCVNETTQTRTASLTLKLEILEHSFAAEAMSLRDRIKLFSGKHKIDAQMVYNNMINTCYWNVASGGLTALEIKEKKDLSSYENKQLEIITPHQSKLNPIDEREILTVKEFEVRTTKQIVSRVIELIHAQRVEWHK
jgi:hypothetical protein